MSLSCTRYSSFFFHATPTTDIYTLSLHDALPISLAHDSREPVAAPSSASSGSGRASSGLKTALPPRRSSTTHQSIAQDRKSTRLNSSHTVISYAVFCLKKKKQQQTAILTPNTDVT